ncbi:HTH-type transcriptional regulator GltC [Paenibacillus solanacearum]|uniref:HTH-type transcriptional regulator GltC n=1 Tax=Paenibacillus solanacearum TaxID=2048548 RepID=A0A916KAQ2_9BACL|nr:LysR family transcriptional regulator [Paenibacillus solanacearum]CAG7652366.1 HTH-type transcriptional regulator GltC [Paenibacillus solanacearum]
MQVEWYRSFAEAAKWRSLSKAAEKLNLTQPAISKHIRRLEEAYGVELFRRGPAGVEVTGAGALFMERIGPVLASLEALTADMRQFAERPRITLGSLPSVAAQVLPARLRDHYAAGHPIAVSVRPSSSELLEGLGDGSLDAVLMDDAYTAGRLWRRELFTESYIAVLPQGHRMAGRVSLSAAELERELFIFPVCCDTRLRFAAIAEKHGYKPHVILEVDHNDYLLGIVAVGNGITVLPALFAGQSARLGLHAVPIEEESLRRTIVLAARSSETGAKLYRLLGGGTEQQHPPSPQTQADA